MMKRSRNMPQVIGTNVLSLNAQRNLNSSGSSLATSLQRLSSGLRINSAKDDAAGLAISNRMTAQIRGLNQASRNANDGISLAQTAEGDLGAITNGLQRIRELAVQSANATNSATDRAALQAEASQLIAEIDRISVASSFNGVSLLDGTFTSQQFQVGANSGQTIDVSSISSARSADLGQSNTASQAGTAVTAALSTGDLTINGNAVATTARDAAAIATAISNASSDVTATATNTQTIAFGDSASATVQTATTATLGGAYTQANSNAANAVANASAAGGVFTTAVSSAANETYSLSVDGVTAFTVTSAGANENFTAANADTQITANTAALNAAGITVAGTAAGGDLVFSRADGASFDIVAATGFATTPGGFAGANFANGTNTINNGSVARTDNAFTLELDGAQVYTESGGVGAQVTAAELDTAVSTFVSNSNGAYSITSGTIAGGDLVLSKADGSDVALTITSNFTAGPSGQAGAFNGSSSLSSTNGTTIAEAVAPTYSLDIDGNILDFTTDAADGTITGSEAAALIDSLADYTASFSGGNITLSKADGSNIVLTETGADSAGAEGFAVSTQTLYGSVSVTSTNANLEIGGANVANAGLTSGTTLATASGVTVAATDISTVAGANDAIVSIDAALDSVNSSRGDLGAIQSRFESVVSSLSTTAENLSAARSRIQDADFAAETAALTKNQILQQAGISILSQANSQPQLVLSLLQ